MTANTESSILLGFIEEAQSYLPTIRQSLGRFRADASQIVEIELAHRQVHTIHGAAMMVGLPELGELAQVLENKLESLLHQPTELSPETATLLFTHLDQVEIALNETACALNANATSNEDFSAEMMKNFVAEEDSDTNFATTDAEIPEDEEIDPELLEVFALEAEDLLQNLTAHLSILEKSAKNKDSLSEIRRSSHTLKGAAGVIGFKTITKLAHRMEDLLDVIAENPIHSTFETTALLISTTDILEALSRGQGEATLKSEMESVYARFNQLFAALAPNSNQSQTAETVSVSQSENETVPENPVSTTDFESSGLQTVKAAQVSTVAPRPTVRVSVENLDSLVNLVSELIINRSVMEQKVSVLENQVGELQLNTNRLRRLANKLDADYEAETMGFGSNPVFGTIAPMFAENNSAPDFPQLFLDEPRDNYGFDELEFDKYTEIHQLTRELLETASDSAAVGTELEDLLGDLDTVLTRERRLTDEMQEKLMRVRMVPIGTLFSRLQRTVRVVSEQEGKLADFAMDGKDVELDTQVLDIIAEPLLHLLRNAIGHGIESPEERRQNGKHSRGLIQMRIYNEATSIVISISDDGNGINPHRLRERAVRNGFITMQEAAAMSDEETFSLIFLPGLSTAKELTDISGRGVGMDIVREVISRQQGTISVKSVAEQGTTFIIRLPMSMAVTRALIVTAGGQNFALPLTAISRVISATTDDFDLMSQEKVIWVNGKFYPVFRLNEILGFPAGEDLNESRISTLLLNLGETTVALVVEQIIEATEIVLKPFNKLLKNLRGYLGATILGNGDVVPILEVVSLLDRQAVKKTKTGEKNMPVANAKMLEFAEQLTVMLVDDSPSVRRVMMNLVTNAGWKAIVAKDGLEALEMLQVANQMPNIILSDVEMPRMDGYELLSSLKRQPAFREIPVIMITSRAAEKHRQKALDLGASEYVIKPYQDSFLLDTIRVLTEKS